MPSILSTDLADVKTLPEPEASAYWLFHQGFYRKVVDILKPVVEKSEDYTACRHSAEILAMSQVRLKQFNDGLKTQSTLVKQFPDDPDIRANYGAIFAQINRPKRAKNELLRAVTLGADSMYVHNTFSAVYSELKEFDSARIHGKKALAIKDNLACKHFDYARFKLKDRVFPVFDHSKPARNVITFGL